MRFPTNGKARAPTKKLAEYHSVTSHNCLGILKSWIDRRLGHRYFCNDRKCRGRRHILVIDQVVVSLGASQIFLDYVENRL